MSRLKIEKGASKVRRAPLKVTIDGTVSDDLELMCKWSENDSSYLVNLLLGFAIAQSEEFQRYKAEQLATSTSIPAGEKPAPELPRKASPSATVGYLKLKKEPSPEPCRTYSLSFAASGRVPRHTFLRSERGLRRNTRQPLSPRSSQSFPAARGTLTAGDLSWTRVELQRLPLQHTVPSLLDPLLAGVHPPLRAEAGSSRRRVASVSRSPAEDRTLSCCRRGPSSVETGTVIGRAMALDPRARPLHGHLCHRCHRLRQDPGRDSSGHAPAIRVPRRRSRAASIRRRNSTQANRAPRASYFLRPPS